MKKISILLILTLFVTMFSACGISTNTTMYGDDNNPADSSSAQTPKEEIVVSEESASGSETEEEAVESEESEKAEEPEPVFYGNSPYTFSNTYTHITPSGELIASHPALKTMEIGKNKYDVGGFLYHVNADKAMEPTNLGTTPFDTIYDINSVSGDDDRVMGFVSHEGVTYFVTDSVVCTLSQDLETQTVLFDISEDDNISISSVCMINDSFIFATSHFSDSGKNQLLRYSLDGECLGSVDCGSISGLQYCDGNFYYRAGTAVYKTDYKLSEPVEVTDELFTENHAYFIKNGLTSGKYFFITSDKTYFYNGASSELLVNAHGSDESEVIAKDIDMVRFDGEKFILLDYSSNNYRSYSLYELGTEGGEPRHFGSYSSGDHVEYPYTMDIVGDFVFMNQPGDFTNVHKISTDERSGYPIVA